MRHSSSRGKLTTPIRLSAGYTLIEVVVAVTIMAVIGAASHRLLGSLVGHLDSFRNQSQDTRSIKRLVVLLDQDMRQLINRGIRDAYGLPASGFSTPPDYLLEFTRLGWRNPNGIKRAELQRVAYRLRYGEMDGSEARVLERLTWDVLDRAPNTEPRVQILMQGVETVDVMFYDREGTESLVWDSAYGMTDVWNNALPAAIQWEIQLVNGGMLTRFYRLPGVQGERSKKTKAGAGREDVNGGPGRSKQNDVGVTDNAS